MSDINDRISVLLEVLGDSCSFDVKYEVKCSLACVEELKALLEAKKFLLESK